MPLTRRIAVRHFILSAAIVTIAGRPALPVEPGVDIAAPKVAISVANGTTLRFVPANPVVEQFDYVRWNTTSGVHTTTSGMIVGSTCTPDGLWNSNLNTTVPTFTRAFDDPPASYRYFCTPHCALGMNGTVTVTTPIDMRLNESGADVRLDWTGGGGLFRVFRSTSPLFTSATTTVLSGAGTQAFTFLDPTGGTPPVGAANFYLVMNHF